MNALKKQGYIWVTLVLFLGSLIGHWVFGFQTGQTWQENLRDTFENWQSEFLQLVWQVGGLMIFLAVGSQQSKSESERVEAKLNYIIYHMNNPTMTEDDAERFQQELNKRYPKE